MSGKVPSVRRANRDQRNSRPKKKVLQRLFARLRGERASPSLSDMLPAPDFLEHHFGQISNREQPWWVLLIPTYEEGEDILEIAPRLLAKRDDDFTLIFAAQSTDKTIDALERAQQQDGRIVYVLVDGKGIEALEGALIEELHRLEKERGRKATDTLIVPFTMLSIHPTLRLPAP